MFGDDITLVNIDDNCEELKHVKVTYSISIKAIGWKKMYISQHKYISMHGNSDKLHKFTAARWIQLYNT